MERTAILERQVGHGDLELQIRVSQVYSHYQHTDGILVPRQMRRPFIHPRGGKHYFLRDAVRARTRRSFVRLARGCVDQKRNRVVEARSVLNDLITATARATPVESGRLRNSGSGKVVDDRRTVYARAQRAPRATAEQLRAARRSRAGRRDRRR